VAAQGSGAQADGEAGVTYLIVIGGTLAAGVIPALAYVGYRAAKARERKKVSRSRRDKKIDL